MMIYYLSKFRIPSSFRKTILRRMTKKYILSSYTQSYQIDFYEPINLPLLGNVDHIVRKSVIAVFTIVWVHVLSTLTKNGFSIM